MRVGNQQKKVDINVPSLNDFVHKVYINTARKIYTNIYLFEKNIGPLQIQKHNRELEMIVREQILNSIRENIPVENILKVYLDETIENDVQVEESEEIISTEPVEEEVVTDDKTNDDEDEEEKEKENEKMKIDPLEGIGDISDDSNKADRIQFNDVDKAIGTDNIIEEITAPKTIERLEQLSHDRAEARNIEEKEEDEDRITIGEKIKLTDLDVHDLEKPKETNKVPIGLEEIEILT